MTLLRRFKLYFIGVFLGLILGYGLFKDRYPTWLHDSVIKKELQGKNIIFTKHAICRMNCRNITKEEVLMVLKEGDVNFKKSRVHEKPCPSYAFDASLENGKHLRIIFSKCDTIAKVVTAIDLNKKHECNCQ